MIKKSTSASIGRPKAKTKLNKSKHLSIRVTPSTHKLISKVAKSKKMSITQYIVNQLKFITDDEKNSKTKVKSK